MRLLSLRRAEQEPWPLLLQALAVLALLGFWLWGLGSAPLLDVDEGAFAEASREMLSSGDWLHTTLNGADRFDKPILVYWLQALSIALFGATEFAVRLPSALCAWLWCLVLAAFAAERGGRRAGWAAAVLTAGALGPLIIGRAATADALLNLLLALTCLDLLRHLRSGDVALLRRAACWSAAAVLTKGPIGVLIPLAVVLLWAWSTGQGRRALAMLRDGRAWLYFGLIALPWYIYAVWRHGAAFVEGFVLRHNVERFVGPLEGHAGTPFFHLVALPVLLLPWAPLLLMGGVQRWRGWWAEQETRFLIVWAAFVLVFFTLAGTKLPHYALYGATPLIVLAALSMADARWWWPMAVALPAAAGLALLGASPWLAWRLAEVLPQLQGETGFDPAVWPAVWPLGITAALLVLTVALGMPLRGGTVMTAPRRVLAIVIVQAAAMVWGLLPWWARVLQQPVRELGLHARAAAPQTIVQWRVHQPSFAFYAGRPAPRRTPQAGEWALTLCQRLSDAEKAGWVTVARRQAWCLVSPP